MSSQMKDFELMRYKSITVVVESQKVNLKSFNFKS